MQVLLLLTTDRQKKRKKRRVFRSQLVWLHLLKCDYNVECIQCVICIERMQSRLFLLFFSILFLSFFVFPWILCRALLYFVFIQCSVDSNHHRCCCTHWFYFTIFIFHFWLLLLFVCSHCLKLMARARERRNRRRAPLWKHFDSVFTHHTLV